MAEKKQTPTAAGRAKDRGRAIAGSLLTFGLELILIILGVVLGLVLNEWRQNAAFRQEADRALINVAREIEANRLALGRIHENNVRALQAMRTAPMNGDTTAPKFSPGLQLRETAWQAVLSTKAANYIDYDTLLLLSETYAIQQTYKQAGTLLAEAVLNMSSFSVATGKRIDEGRFQQEFMDYFQMLTDLEDGMLKSYSHALQKLPSHIDRAHE